MLDVLLKLKTHASGDPATLCSYAVNDPDRARSPPYIYSFGAYGSSVIDKKAAGRHGLINTELQQGNSFS